MMRKLTVASIAMIVLGVALLAYSVYSREAQVYILFIIPVFTGGSLAAFGGTILLFGGIFLFFFSLAGPAMIERVEPAEAHPPPTARTSAAKTPQGKFGGVVLLGPIPIVLGSDEKVTKWMLVVLLVIVIILLVAMLYFAPASLRPP